MKVKYITEMYMNIYTKYGKQSKELQRFKGVYHKYPNHAKILHRVYVIIMKGE